MISKFSRIIDVHYVLTLSRVQASCHHGSRRPLDTGFRRYDVSKVRGLCTRAADSIFFVQIAGRRRISKTSLIQQALKQAGRDLFVTTDDRLIKRMRKIGGLPVMLPGEALAFVENWYEN